MGEIARQEKALRCSKQKNVALLKEGGMCKQPKGQLSSRAAV